MGNETQKEPARDLAKKRQEYVRKKVVTLSALWTARAMVLSAILCGILMSLSLVVYLNYIPHHLWNENAPDFQRNLLIEMVLVISCPGIAALCFFVGKDQSKKEKEIEYVPPVREQIAALRAHEILLRGADEPDTTPDELLRAAQAGMAEPAEELLRANVVQAAQSLPEETTIEQRSMQ